MTQPTLKTSNGAVSTAISSSIASPAATTEVLPKAKRRTFSVAYKQQLNVEGVRSVKFYSGAGALPGGYYWLD